MQKQELYRNSNCPAEVLKKALIWQKVPSLWIGSFQMPNGETRALKNQCTHRIKSLIETPRKRSPGCVRHYLIFI